MAFSTTPPRFFPTEPAIPSIAEQFEDTCRGSREGHADERSGEHDDYEERRQADHERELALRHRAYLARRLRESARRAQLQQARTDAEPTYRYEDGRPIIPVAPRQPGGLLRNLALSSVLAITVGAGTGYYLSTDRSDGARWGAAMLSALSFRAPAIKHEDTDPKVVPPAPQPAEKRVTAKVLPEDNKPEPEAPPAGLTGFDEPEVVANPGAAVVVSNASGVSDEPVGLDVSARPAGQNGDFSLRLTGLPTHGKLSAGEKLPDGSWLLTPEDTSNLKLLLPDNTAGTFTLAVEAINVETGQLVAPVKRLQVSVKPKPQQTASGKVIVQPAAESVANSRNFSADAQNANNRALPGAGNALVELPPPPPPSVEEQPRRIAALNTDEALDTVKLSLSRNTLNGLITRGEELLNVGNVIGARRLFEKAARSGNPQAALRIGRTYDPVVFEQLRVHGMSADADRAMHWYKKAKSAGLASADREIKILRNWLKK